MEASRILAVLEDAVSQLRLAAVVTSDEVMDRLEVLEDAVSKESLLALYELRAAVDDDRENEGGAGTQDDDFVVSTAVLARRAITALQADAGDREALEQLGFSVSPAYSQLIAELTRLVSFTQRQLSTTVEEEKGRDLHFRDVVAREERANNERMALEQQLRAERRERNKAAQLAEAVERRTRGELGEIQASIGMTRDRVEQEASATSGADTEWFEKQKASLLRRVENYEKEVAELQVENRARETKLRKKKANVVDQVHTAIQEYDRELGEKEAAYRTELGEYKEVQRALAECEASMETVKGAIARLDAIKAAQVEAREVAVQKAEQRRDEAAAYIQRAWRRSRTAAKTPPPPAAAAAADAETPSADADVSGDAEPSSTASPAAAPAAADSTATK